MTSPCDSCIYCVKEERKNFIKFGEKYCSKNRFHIFIKPKSCFEYKDNKRNLYKGNKNV